MPQGCIKVGMSTLSRPAGRIEGCGVEPFTPFDTPSARGTLWVQDAHFCDFDLALTMPRFDSIPRRCDNTLAPENQDARMHEQTAQVLLTLYSQAAALKLLPRTGCLQRGVAHAEQMLEILASVSLCDSKPFRSLQNLVIEHTASLSGCICIFLEWDEPRHELVRYLKQIGLPLTVLIVRGPEETAGLDPGPLQDAPECLHVLKAGQIAEGLQKIAS